MTKSKQVILAVSALLFSVPLAAQKNICIFDKTGVTRYKMSDIDSVVYTNTIFSDYFEKNTGDKWLYTGSNVFYQQEDSVIFVSTSETDHGGEVLSTSFRINPKKKIRSYRQVKLTKGNDQVAMLYTIMFGSKPGFEPATPSYGMDPGGVAITYCSYDYIKRYGVFIGAKSARDKNANVKFVQDVPWDEWFTEIVEYDPTTGIAKMFIENMEFASVYVGKLTPDKCYARVSVDAYGWWTEHKHFMGYIDIEQ